MPMHEREYTGTSKRRERATRFRTVSKEGQSMPASTEPISQAITNRRQRTEDVRTMAEELRQKVEPSIRQVAGESLATVTGDAIHEAGEIFGKAAGVEGFLEETAEISSEGGFVLLQKGIAFADKHIKGFETTRKKIGTKLNSLHSAYLEKRAQSMVGHPKHFYNRVALRTMLSQTVKESQVSWYEKWQRKHPKIAMLARSPLTAAEIASLLPLWIPLPLRNRILPIPLFFNQMCTLVAVNSRKSLIGLFKGRPLEFGIYGSFSLLDFVLPMFNAYPVAPAIDAFVSNHYHKKRRIYIDKLKTKLSEEGIEAEQMKTFLQSRLIRAKQRAKNYRNSENMEHFTLRLQQQKEEIFLYRPRKKVINEHSVVQRAKERVKKIPIVSIPVHATDLLTNLRRHLDILRWKGKMESVEELESMTQLFLTPQPARR